jgi:hypothetical protein
MNDIRKIRHALRKIYGCESTHIETYSVHEMMDGKTVWQGEVEEFELIDHETKFVFAWTYPRRTRDEFVTVLKIPPVETARDAVQIAIASGKAR